MGSLTGWAKGELKCDLGGRTSGSDEDLCGNHHLRRKGMVIWGSAIDHQNWQA